jgi:hypothetical protein
VSLYREAEAVPVATGIAPATFRVARGQYSVRFEFDGATHWRRDVSVWQRENRIAFHW